MFYTVARRGKGCLPAEAVQLRRPTRGYPILASGRFAAGLLKCRAPLWPACT